MKWFKLDCDFRNDPKILCLTQQFGGKGACSFWVLLLAYVGAHGMPNCEIKVDPFGPHSPYLLATFVHAKPKVVLTMLEACANLSLINAERWRNDSVISIPNMLKRVDDYTRKIRTLSVVCPEKPAVEQIKIENRIEEERNKITAAPLEPKTAKVVIRDLAADEFSAYCLQSTNVPYVFQAADFVHLAKLRKAYSLVGKLTPPGWTDAIARYFGSPVTKYTMADMVVRYTIFHNSPVNTYGRPVNHGRTEHDSRTKAQITFDNTRAAAQRFLSGSTDPLGGSVSSGIARIDHQRIPKRIGLPVLDCDAGAPEYDAGGNGSGLV